MKHEDENYKKTVIILVNKKLFVILLRTTFYKTPKHGTKHQ